MTAGPGLVLAEAIAAIRALPNPRATSGEWRRRDWDDGRAAAANKRHDEASNAYYERSIAATEEQPDADH
jgi:hypothetical protein